MNQTQIIWAIILGIVGVAAFSAAITLHLWTDRNKARSERDVALRVIGRIAKGRK